MAGLNLVEVIGYMGAVPELRRTASGDAVANLRVGVTERWKDKQGLLQEKTEWVTCTAWGKRAESAASMLKKGSLVLVMGSLRTTKREIKKGVETFTAYDTTVTVNEWQFLDRPTKDAPESPGQRQRPGSDVPHTPGPPEGWNDVPPPGDDDIPF